MIRAAGYCRVSTDRGDQANSFEAQRRYFTDYIRSRPDWQLTAIYADEGISGTSTHKRVQFNRMLRDARAGLFDLIVTKEVSRFSRNILDTVACTRELKALGIGVLFVTDGINTLDPDAELRLSIMGSIAQEESRRTSARVKWGQTRQMERGVVFGRSLLGYRVEGGNITLVPEEADVVRAIYRKYTLEGKGTSVIARELLEAGWRPLSGRSAWSAGHLLKILKNEKYKGDLVQRKTCTPDYLTHRREYNHGQEELVIVRDHHEPIVSVQLWEQTQAELRRRSRRNGSSSGKPGAYLLSGRIRCGCCGSILVCRKRRRPDGSYYRRWSCPAAARGSPCSLGRSIREERAADCLRAALLSLQLDRRAIASDVAKLISAVQGGGETARLEQHHRRLMRKKEALVDAYLSGELTPPEFSETRQRLDRELETAREKLRRAETCRSCAADLTHRAEALLREGSDALLRHLLQEMTLFPDGALELRLRGLDALWRFPADRR